MVRRIEDTRDVMTGGASRRDLLRLAAAGSAGLAMTVAFGRGAFATTEGEIEPEGTPTEGTPVGSAGKVHVYSGRNENLVGGLIGDFEPDTGIDAEVRYGDTAELAATILEEGDNSPADVFFSQDAGALGALENEGALERLPDELLNKVDPKLRSKEGVWIATSARVRVAVYNTDQLQTADLPASVLDFVDPTWKGKVGWAPENASFQAFVTALRVLNGEDAARAWLEEMKANEPKTFESNGAITRAVGAGEIPVGLVNHYYLYEVQAEDKTTLPIANHFFQAGDPGSLINVAGVGMLKTAQHKEQALGFANFLLGHEAQDYFADVTFEYPVDGETEPVEGLTPLSEIQAPKIDLADLADLPGTIALLTEVGIL